MGHVRPLVQLVGHDHSADETDEEHAPIWMPGDIEEEERGDDDGQADEHIVGVDGDEVALRHRHRINMVVTERLDELLSDDGRLGRTEVVEQEMDDSRGQIRDCVGSENETDDEEADRPRQAVTDLDNDLAGQQSGKADERADGDEFENSMARRVVVSAQHPSIITCA